ncbi:MAG: DNA mismatch repair endonuclease MutH [Pseudomonadota bacterium]
MADFPLHPASTPPEDIEVLGHRVRCLAGRRIGELAARAGLAVPVDSVHGKGFVGQLIELWLGAGASSLARPDFTQLGVELKTLPVNHEGKPLQSTYVSRVPLHNLHALEWNTSTVFTKLRHVLWVPVQSDRELALVERVVGQAFFWQPRAEEDALLRADWEFHLARILAGDVERIRGSDGAVLQVRPKASSSRASTWSRPADGDALLTGPRGFYLRPAFTRYLIERYFHGRMPEDLAGLKAEQRRPDGVGAVKGTAST